MAIISRSFRRYSCSASVTALCGATALASGAAALALGVPACTDTKDLADDAGAFEGGSDSSSAASSDCTACAGQECTGPWSVCLTDSRCVALRACNNPFGESQGAREQCFCDSADAGPATPEGGADPLAAYAAFAACSDARTCGKCASDCTSACTGGAPSHALTTASCAPANDAGDAGDANAPASDAGDAGDGGDASDAADAAAVAPPVTPSVDACASCVADKCGDAKQACALATECSVFLGCAYACSDASCVDACAAAHATGQAGAMELSSCTLTSCRSACGL